MSTKDADRKLAEDVADLCCPLPAYAAGIADRLEDKIPQLRALFSAPRQVTEAEIEAAAKGSFLARAGKSKWENLDDYMKSIWILEAKAGFVAAGLYTPPKAPTPGKRFAEDFKADYTQRGITSQDPESSVRRKAILVDCYDAATAKAIYLLELIKMHGAVDAASAEKALADLRCEGGKRC